MNFSPKKFAFLTFKTYICNMFFRISVFRNHPSRLVASCTNLFLLYTLTSSLKSYITSPSCLD